MNQAPTGTIPEDTERALSNAHALADEGVPIFAGRLTAEGNPDRMDRRWKAWEKKQPGRASHAAISTWRPGDALCAVTGVVFDVIDYDPRNDPAGNTPALLEKALGDDGPEVYMRVSTPSGGYHLYIATLGIAKTKLAGYPGIDIQAGRPDGSGRGFVFMPPTLRLSKTSGEIAPYRLRLPVSHVNGDSGSSALRKLASERTLRSADDAREEPEALRKACIDAEAGGQREALLRYVHELERRGYLKDDIVKLCQSLKLEDFDPKRPWRAADFRNLLHRPGEVVPDALPGELDGIKGPIRKGLVKSLVDEPDEMVEWLWEEYLPVSDLTLIDGEKGQGKTFAVYDVAARGSRGRAMPGKAEAIVEPFSTIIFTYEGLGAVKPRLLAANADLKRIFVPVLDKKKRAPGQEDPLALPGGAGMIGRMIAEANARLAIFDPIADFLDRDTSTHNDASVRIALKPLGDILRSTGAAGLAIRHMNKDKTGEARFRGTGSSAFQNRGRVHLICGELPDRSDDGERRFAIGMADSNDTRRIGGALAYEIVDSEIALDEHGRFVGRVKWEGYVDVDVNSLSRGPNLDRRSGPKPVIQEMAEEVVNELFAQSRGYPVPAGEVMDALREAGCSTSPTVLAKVRASLGIRTVQQRGRGKAGVVVTGWMWVMDG